MPSQDLAGSLAFPTRKEAELMEEHHAAILREKGYAIWQR